MRNLGPLQLDLLAPFTKLDPYWGTAVGVGARRGGIGDRRVVVGAPMCSARSAPVRAMLATIARRSRHRRPRPFIDPRQQIYLLLPYWALLWLTWATAMGTGAAIGPLVFAASLIVADALHVRVPDRAARAGRARLLRRSRPRPVEGGQGHAPPARRAGRRRGVLGADDCWTSCSGSATWARCSPSEEPTRGSAGSMGPGSSPAPCCCRCVSGCQTALVRSMLPADLASPGVGMDRPRRLAHRSFSAPATVAWRRGNEAGAMVGLIAAVAAGRGRRVPAAQDPAECIRMDADRATSGCGRQASS